MYIHICTLTISERFYNYVFMFYVIAIPREFGSGIVLLTRLCSVAFSCVVVPPFSSPIVDQYNQDGTYFRYVRDCKDVLKLTQMLSSIVLTSRQELANVLAQYQAYNNLYMVDRETAIKVGVTSLVNAHFPLCTYSVRDKRACTLNTLTRSMVKCCICTYVCICMSTHLY